MDDNSSGLPDGPRLSDIAVLRVRDHIKYRRLVRVSATEGTTSHCNMGDSPVPMSGNTGISREYAQFWRTVVFSHSL